MQRVFDFETKFSLFVTTHYCEFDHHFLLQNMIEIQKMNGDHYMSVILRGTEPTNVDITQASHQNKSYSVTNYCYTTSGCTINVTQN